MSNLKLGTHTISGIDTVQIENADSAGSYVTFKLDNGSSSENFKHNFVIQNTPPKILIVYG